MKSKMKVAPLVLIMVCMLQLLLASTAFAASSITKIEEKSVDEHKLCLKVTHDQIKTAEVYGIQINIPELRGHVFVEKIDQKYKGSNPKKFEQNSIFYEIYDGYIIIYIDSNQDLARMWGSQKKELEVIVTLTSGKRLTIKETIKGNFRESTLTPVDPDEEYSDEYLFTDFRHTSTAEHWAYEHVKHMKELGIAEGGSKNYLHGEAPITLKEFIAYLARTLKYMGKANNTDLTNVYKSNIVEDDWAKEEYAILMNALGIVSEETTNKGKTELDRVMTADENINSRVTREEAAILMAAFLGDSSNTENPNDFKDWNRVNNKGRIARLCEFGVMYGSREADGLYIMPTREITRVEALALLDRFMLVKDSIIVAPKSETEITPSVSDSTVPSIAFNPLGGTTVKINSTVSFTVSEIESNITNIRYSWDNDVAATINNINSKSYSKSVTVPSTEGNHTLKVWANNAGGKSTGWIDSQYVVSKNAANVDTTPPTIKLTVGNKDVGIFTLIQANTYNTATLKAEDPESGVAQISYHWNNDAEIVVANDTVVINLPTIKGEHILYVKAQNTVGLTTEGSYKYYSNGGSASDVDTTAPEVTINTTLSQISIKDIIQVTAKDNESGVAQIVYHWNNDQETINECNGATKITIPVNVPQTAGRHTLYVKAMNNAGVWSSEKVYNFDIINSSKPIIPGTNFDIANDKTPAEISINTELTKISIKDELKITAKDNESGVSQIVYRWNSDAETVISCNALEMTIPINVPQSVGTHYLYVKAQNGAGIWSQEKLYIFEIDNSDKPMIEDEIDSPVKVIIDGDDDDSNYNDGENGNVVEPGTELIITGEEPDEIVQIGYHWNNEPEQIVDGKELKVKIPETVGTHYLYVRVKNKDGVWSAVRRYKFEVVEDIDDVKIKEVSIIIKDYKTSTVVVNKVYDWDDIENNKITIKAPTKVGTYMLYVKVINNKNNIVEAKEYKFKIKEIDEDDENEIANLVGKTKLTKTGLTVELTRDGNPSINGGMVTYPGNPELIGLLNPNIDGLRVEIRNADEKLAFQPKEEVKYYIDFYNGGSKKISNVKIEVEIPEGFEVVSASNDGQIDEDAVSWDLGDVKAGGGDRYALVIKYTDKFDAEINFSPIARIYISKDMKDESWVYNLLYVSGTASSGYHSQYVIGYPDGTFKPQGQITRAEMAAMCAKLFELSGYSGSAFYDLDPTHWANPAINACVGQGIIDPYGDYFDPSSPATRAVFAIALARYLGVADIEPIFINSNDTEEHYAMKEMEQLIRLGLVDGYPDGSAGPNNLVTRAEAVTMLNKYAFRGGLTLSNYSNYGSSYVFADLSNGHWALNQILEAALDHSYVRTDNGEERSY